MVLCLIRGRRPWRTSHRCCREASEQFGGLRQFKLRGRDNVSAVFRLHVIAYNLIRLSNILMPAMVVA